MKPSSGIVRWFSSQKGFGYLLDVDGQDRFFHLKDVYGSTRLARGDAVLYEPYENDRGPAAKRVALSGSSGANSAISMDFGVGKKVLDRIKNARRSVKVVSPYLSAGYVEALVELERNGIEVMLLTADDLDRSGKADRALIRQARHVDEARIERRAQGAYYAFVAASIFIGVILVCGLIFVLLGFPIPATGVAVAGGAFVVGIAFIFTVNYFRGQRIYSYSYGVALSSVRIFMSSRNSKTGASGGERLLVHAKAYVIDEEVAYVGSLNFSYSGFNKNYEVCVEVKNPVAVRRLSERIDALYGNDRLARRDLCEWGRSLYPEPKNDGKGLGQFLKESIRTSRTRS